MPVLLVVLAMIIAGIGCRRERPRLSLYIGLAGFGLTVVSALLLLGARQFRAETGLLVYFAVVSGLLIFANVWSGLRRRYRFRAEGPRQIAIESPLRARRASNRAVTEMEAPAETCEMPR
jgi:hypothetical protein